LGDFMISLAGRLEAVYVDSALQYSNHATGLLDHYEKGPDTQGVIIVNGAPQQGRTCLVRCEVFNKGNLWTGYLISPSIPEGFLGLAPEKYVLVGLNVKRSANIIPHFGQVCRHYQPGWMDSIFYIAFSPTGTRTAIITRDGWSEISLDGMLTPHLPHPRESARIVLADRLEQFQQLKQVVRDEGLVPIVIEPIIAAP
jgi:hypothetical protein